MPLFHMAGSGWAFAGLWAGATTVVLRDVDPAAILDAVAEHRITNLLLVPAVIQFLLDTRASRPPTSPSCGSSSTGRHRSATTSWYGGSSGSVACSLRCTA